MRNGQARNAFLAVTDGENTVALAYADSKSNFWAYAPEKKDFRRNDGLFRDFFDNDGGRHFKYQLIGPHKAQALINAGIGKSDDRMLTDLENRASLSKEAVFAAVTNNAGATDPRTGQVASANRPGQFKPSGKNNVAHLHRGAGPAPGRSGRTDRPPTGYQL